MEEATPAVKKTSRSRKISTATTVPQVTDSATAAPKTSSGLSNIFSQISAKIAENKAEFENLIKQIDETKQSWVKEQKEYDEEITRLKEQDEIDRKREQETYDYTTALARKRAEDEFTDKKSQWEKDLAQRKQELAEEQKELEGLRKMAADFDSQKATAIKEAQNLLQQQLTGQFETDKKMREQEFKSEKEILNLKITSLTSDNNRLNGEVTAFKKALEEATQQVKEIAIKVIEARNQPKDQTPLEP